MESLKTCPYCNEKIQATAKKCRWCGEWLATPTGSPDAAEDSGVDTLLMARNALSTRYDILDLVGRGGMASVYRAVQKNLNRIIALKVIHQSLLHDDEFVARFKREAEINASLKHPNIVTIFDIGVEKGLYFIAMEFLSGKSLSKIIKERGSLSLDETFEIITGIASGLDHIHSKRLVHRDIKSPNIIVTDDGRCVVTDFGIAHAAEGTKITIDGKIIGTPEYMSPEQAEGREIDGRSDLFSLGIVMYECLTGKLPFKGETSVNTLYKIVHEPHTTLTGQPAWVRDILHKLLEKERNRRYSSGEEIIFDIKNAGKSKIPFLSSRSSKLVTPVSIPKAAPPEDKTQVIDKQDEIKAEETLIVESDEEKTRKMDADEIPVPIPKPKTSGKQTGKFIFAGVLLMGIIAGVLFLPDLIRKKGTNEPVKAAEQITWKMVVNTSGDHYASRIVQLSSGEYALAGNAIVTGQNSFYYGKLDRSGKIIVENVYSSGGTSVCDAVVNTSDGNLAFCGEWREKNNGDVRVLKINSAGNVLWDRSFGGADEERTNSMVASKNNAVIVVGTSRSHPGGNDNIYLLKVDNAGNKIWEKWYGGADAMCGNDCIELDNGHIIILGTVLNGALNSIILFEVDSQGNTLWRKLIVTQKNDIPYKIIKTEKGYLIAGSYTMPPDKTSRAFWASVDDAGNLIKYNIVEPNKYSEFRGLLETPDKEYILAGLIRPENAKPYHSYLCKINSAGALIWQRVFTNAASSWANSVITAADGGYALAGGIGTTGNAYSVYVIKTDVNGEIKPAQK